MLLLILSCPIPTAEPPPVFGDGIASNYLRGLVYDSITGEPVEGVTVSFGSRAAESGWDGSFIIEFGQSSGILEDSWSVYKDGYQFTHVGKASVDASRNWEVSFPIRRTDVASYLPATALTGRIFFSDGTTQVPDGSTVSIYIYSTNGTFNSYDGVTYDSLTGGYSVDTPECSADCLLIAFVSPVGGSNFVAMAQGVDLTDSLVTQDLTEPGSGYVDVAVTAQEAGAAASCYFVTPYGQITGYFRDTGPVVKEEWLFTAGAETVPVYNPFNWTKVVWIQRTEDAGFNGLPHHAKYLMSSSAIIVFSNTVSLPANDLTLGPEGAADPASLSFDGALALAPVGGASLYSFTLEDVGENVLGRIHAFSSNVWLPSRLILSLGASNPTVKIKFEVMDSDLSSLDLSLVGLDRFPPNLNIGMVQGVTTPYEKTVSVPQSGAVVVGLE